MICKKIKIYNSFHILKDFNYVQQYMIRLYHLRNEKNVLDQIVCIAYYYKPRKCCITLCVLK